MNKPLTKLFLVSGLVFGALSIIEAMTWVVSGNGLFEQFFGGKTPLLVAIAGQIAQMPLWAFLVLVSACIVVLSFLISVALISTFKKELIK